MSGNRTIYDPVPDGMPRSAGSVRYMEVSPPASLSSVVHRFWELRTMENLAEDFVYHALPDACVNLLLNERDPRVAGITRLRTRAEKLNLGRSFHYVGVQLYPGVWQGRSDEILDSYVGSAYLGELPLVQVAEQMVGLPLSEKAVLLSGLVERLIASAHVAPNALTGAILLNLDRIRTVADMAALVGLSTRQLQRALKASVGMPPHDFLKVLRLQQSFRRDYLELYADQSHYINAFRQGTGYTPSRYAATFDV
ncbi:helix-turn-helix domain-containing protein [Silanimonas sp.]|uniref:helix-turn-helix domain-containing protein n=1 Tax=Silanimonas sp. TaxID=1929290 RepID=UPI0037CB76D7